MGVCNKATPLRDGSAPASGAGAEAPLPLPPAAPLARAPPRDAPFSLGEFEIPPLIRIEPAFLQHVLGVPHSRLAVLADDSHQTLSQNAIQRGHKIVGFDTHIQEPAQDIDDVVGVDRGEHQVSAERG